MVWVSQACSSLPDRFQALAHPLQVVVADFGDPGPQCGGQQCGHHLVLACPGRAGGYGSPPTAAARTTCPVRRTGPACGAGRATTGGSASPNVVSSRTWPARRQASTCAKIALQQLARGRLLPGPFERRRRDRPGRMRRREVHGLVGHAEPLLHQRPAEFGVRDPAQGQRLAEAVRDRVRRLGLDQSHVSGRQASTRHGPLGHLAQPHQPVGDLRDQQCPRRPARPPWSAAATQRVELVDARSRSGRSAPAAG